MLLHELLSELGANSVAYLTTQMHGALGYRLREVVGSHPSADIDLQFKIIGSEVLIDVLGIEGEAIAHESIVSLGVESAMPMRAQVILMLWGLEQGRRARAIWLAGVDRKMAKLGLGPPMSAG